MAHWQGHLHDNAMQSMMELVVRHGIHGRRGSKVKVSSLKRSAYSAEHSYHTHTMVSSRMAAESYHLANFPNLVQLSLHILLPDYVSVSLFLPFSPLACNFPIMLYWQRQPTSRPSLRWLTQLAQAPARRPSTPVHLPPKKQTGPGQAKKGKTTQRKCRYAGAVAAAGGPTN